MSVCEQVHPLLSAMIDGELNDDERQRASDHLQSCPTCQQELDELAELDRKLTDALCVDSVETKAARIETLMQSTVLLAAPSRSFRKRLVLTAAMAATLLIALVPIVWHRNQSTTLHSSGDVMVAKLVRATGPVESLAPGAKQWTRIHPNSFESFSAGARVKTSRDVLCEFETASNGRIRLNGSAELILHYPDQVELVVGQLWCSAPPSTSMVVDTPASNLTAPEIASFSCPSSTELQCIVSDDRTSCRADSDIKVWQLPLLAIGGVVDQELVKLLDQLLAPIGMTKAQHLNEKQIRQLGPAGAVPLLAYVAAETNSIELRRTAMRLAVEVADDRSIRFLKPLASDRDPMIADSARDALRRIAKSNGD